MSPSNTTVVKDSLSERIADAESRLRNSIAQRIERNRQELARLQQEQELFEASAASPVGPSGAARATGAAPSDAIEDTADDTCGMQVPTGYGAAAAAKGPLTPPTSHSAAPSVAIADVVAPLPSVAKTESPKEPPLLLRMTVEIGDGRTGEVKVRPTFSQHTQVRLYVYTHGFARHLTGRITPRSCFRKTTSDIDLVEICRGARPNLLPKGYPLVPQQTD